MTGPFQNNVDLNALIDIISNIAGMMILLACVAIVIRDNKPMPDFRDQQSMKPISFPLAYIPDKRSLTVCLKFDKLYELPERDLLEAISKKTVTGEPVHSLAIKKDGVNGEIELTPTITGYRFRYKLDPAGGVSLRSSKQLVDKLNKIMRTYPPNRYFYVFHVWPECFDEFRDIREFLFECDLEVGWSPRTNDSRSFDIIYSVGEYDEKLSTIKAQ